MKERHRVVSNSTTARENLSSVWGTQGGKFDDGIDEIHPEENAKPNKRGPHIRALMGLMEIDEEDFDKNFCIKCGKEHKHRRRYCEACIQERTKAGLKAMH